jgi:L-amino acid N-acyltransferase YncA
MATIRFSSVEDADDCQRIYSPYVRDSAISFEESPPTESEFQKRIRNKIESYPWLVCEHENEVIGFAYAGQLRSRDAYQWSVESSVYVSEESQRAGVAKGLYNSLFETLRLQGFYNVYAGTALPNPPSVEFHQAMGFEPVGVYRNVGHKQGEWHDVKWWCLTLQPHVSDPVPPTPVDKLLDSPELNDAVTTGLPDITI